VNLFIIRMFKFYAVDHVMNQDTPRKIMDMKKLTFLLILYLLFFVGKVEGQCVSAGPDQSICQGNTTNGLGGAIGNDATGASWTSDSGGTFSPDASTLNAKWTPPAGFTGTALLTLTAIGGTCVGSTTSVKIVVTPLPTAAFSYAGSPYCSNEANPSPTFIGGGVAGNFSSTSGLVFVNASTGQVNLSASNPGTYLVTNTIAAAGGCGVVFSTAQITITNLPVATFSYPGTPYCSNAANPSPVFSGGGTAGTFSSTSGLVFVSTSTGQINLSASTPGDYTVTNSIVTSGCGTVTATAPITITKLPVATFSYTTTPYCSGESNPFPTFGGAGVAGTFSSTSGLVFVSISTGQVDLAASAPGTYTVTNTIAAAGGCGIVTANSPITITTQPVASISYTGSPWCGSQGIQNVTLVGTTGGTFSSSPGLTINSSTGAINPATSTAGPYTVIYIIGASGGCGVTTATTSVTILVTPQAPVIGIISQPTCHRKRSSEQSSIIRSLDYNQKPRRCYNRWKWSDCYNFKSSPRIKYIYSYQFYWLHFSLIRAGCY